MRQRRFAGPLLNLAAILTALLALGGLELGLRRFWPLPAPSADAERYLRFLDENRGAFFRLEGTGGERELVQIPAVWKADVAQRYKLAKPSGLKRVLLIGESSADILGHEMKVLLTGSPAGGGLEIMNCAVGAASLEMVEKRYLEAIRYSPDAIIFSVGHTVFVRHPELSFLQLEWLRLSRRSQLLRRLTGHLPTYREADAATERLAILERLIDGLAEDSRRLRIPAFVVTLPSNLWVAPRSEESQRTDPEFLDIVYRHATGREAEAVAALESLVSRKSVPWWHFTLGDWLFRRGGREKAYRQLLLARDGDGLRRRSTSAVNSAVRAAAARGGLTVFDAEQALNRAGPRDIPGWEKFADNIHVRPEIYRAWAQRCFQLLAGRNIGSGPGRTDGPPPRFFDAQTAVRWALELPELDDPAVGTSLVYMLEPWLGDLAKREDAFAAVGDPAKAAIIRLAFAEALWRAGRRAQALAANQEQRRSEPARDEPWAQLAFFRLRAKEPGPAREALLEALRLNPARTDLRFFLAKLETGSGGIGAD